MINKLGGWRYICDYQGQHPDYAEIDDPLHPVDVRIYGRGNKRKAISKATGEVEFVYVVYPENISWAKVKEAISFTFKTNELLSPGVWEFLVKRRANFKDEFY